MTARTQQRFYANCFHERRMGGTRSPKENPAEVPLAAKDRAGAPLSKGPFGRVGISTVRWRDSGPETFASIHREKEMPPPRAYTARKIIPHNRLSRNFNSGTHQLLSISRQRFFSIAPISLAPKCSHCPSQPHPTADMLRARLLRTTLPPRCIHSATHLTAHTRAEKRRIKIFVK